MKNLKIKILTSVLAVSILISMCVSTIASNVKFPDVPEGEWYTEAVYEMDRANIMKGVGGGTFDPHGKLTRAMAVTVLKNLFAGYSQYVNTDGYRNVFDDVPYGTWYTDAVLWANHFKITLGRGDRRFDPDAKITRAEFCTMLTRYFDYAGLWCGDVDDVTVEITDAEEIPQFAKESMIMLAKAGIINLGSVNENGEAVGRVMPDMIIDRAQCATFISRVRAKTEVKLPQMLKELGITSLGVTFYEDNMPEPTLGTYDPSMELNREFGIVMDYVCPPNAQPIDVDKLNVEVYMIDERGGFANFELKDKVYLPADDNTGGILIFRIDEDDAPCLYGCNAEDGEVLQPLLTFTYGDETESIALPVRFYETW